MPEISATTRSLLTSASLVLRLRSGMIKQDWGAVRKAVKDSEAVSVAAEVTGEIGLARAELDNNFIIKQLTDALQRGGPKVRLFCVVFLCCRALPPSLCFVCAFF